jgi:hypothetical protein
MAKHRPNNKAPGMESYVQKVLDIGRHLQENQYTGQLTVTFIFSDGGIRRCFKEFKDDVQLSCINNVTGSYTP